MPGRVAIHGDGIAACCCARQLGQHGIEVSWPNGPKTSGPTLLINRSTQTLLADIFQTGLSLFSDLPVIRKRVVLWGSEPVAKILPHAGVVISEAALVARCRARIESSGASRSEGADWSIQAMSKVSGPNQKHFGSRMARAVSVQIKTADADACWVESLESGWLFLLPCGERNGSLLGIGGPLDRLLGQSRLVAQEIENLIGPETEFAAYPRILDPLCGPGWLACGGGAMSFDPICGEGAGNAVREAILASAVIQLLARNETSRDALAHYSSRLLAGFLRHLDTCAHFYISARRSDWWDSEITRLIRGIEWTQRQLSSLPKPQYRLVGFNLEQYS